MEQPGFRPLTPTSFLERAATVFAHRPALVDGSTRRTYAQLHDRARRLAGFLLASGVGRGDRVATLTANSALGLESHYGVPMAGAVLVAMNTRLTTDELTFIADHSAARVLLHSAELADTARAIAARSERELLLVEAGGGRNDYEAALASAEPVARPVEDEMAPISINYTSGTTGRPKGVTYHHRGAHLQALAMAYHAQLAADSVFLWTLPMFHCNGWCFTWAVTAAGGTHVCLPRVDPAEVWRLVRAEGVTHLNAAPTVLTTIASDPGAEPATERVRVATGGAPPSPALIARMGELNMEITHLYGLTETFGPAVICEWQPEWDERSGEERARLAARQGVGNVVGEQLRVVDDRGGDVPADGATLGEVALRGNNLMVGYHDDEEATRRAVPDGWFRSGDLGVMHPDGYVELKDRAKDIVVSGGENISTIEVEQAVASHPDVLEAAVIGVPDDRWGEVPEAHVTLREGGTASAEDIRKHARAHLARFKVPKAVRFGELPKTSTGKIQKFVLRERAWRGHERRIG